MILLCVLWWTIVRSCVIKLRLGFCLCCAWRGFLCVVMVMWWVLCYLLMLYILYACDVCAQRASQNGRNSTGIHQWLGIKDLREQLETLTSLNMLKDLVRLKHERQGLRGIEKFKRTIRINKECHTHDLYILRTLTTITQFLTWVLPSY